MHDEAGSKKAGSATQGPESALLASVRDAIGLRRSIFSKMLRRMPLRCFPFANWELGFLGVWPGCASPLSLPSAGSMGALPEPK